MDPTADASAQHPPARRGRPVSVAARTAVVEAAGELLRDRGWTGFSVDEVARRTRVSKATIYRHWPRGIELAIEAWGVFVTLRVPTLSTGATVADLRDQMLRLAAFYRGPEGVVIAQLLGAAAGDDIAASMVREHFFGPRRRATVAIIEDGVRSGALRTALPAELVVDMLFGPTVFRALNGQGPLTDSETAQLADVLLGALHGPRPPAR